MKPAKVMLFATLFLVLTLVFSALPDRVTATELTSAAATGEVIVINDQQIPIVSETGFYVFIGVIVVALAGLLAFGMRRVPPPPSK